ncbi:MAG TPA: rRNA maturation RNase YbeY [Patescibacteria group bacterium]|nr:rRNA maturation RNase YbeY [Patescibacteria group bacterium]
MISLTIQVDYASAKWKKAFVKMNSKIEEAVAAAFLGAKKPKAFAGRNFDVAVVLADDKMLKELNHTFRGKNKPTNVLSFPQMKMKGLRAKDLDSFPPDDAIPLGDIVIAHETVAREARTQKKEIEGHTLHMVIHGTLHLLGYDHMSGKDAKAMETLEKEILAGMGYDDPYAEPKPLKKRKS